MFKVSLLLTLNIFTPYSTVSIVNFEQINVGWVGFISTTTLTQQALN